MKPLQNPTGCRSEKYFEETTIATEFHFFDYEPVFFRNKNENNAALRCISQTLLV